MLMQLAVQQPIPTWVNRSYGDFGFYKFGVCCWTYQGGYDGAVEWINTLMFVTQPKLPNPVSFRYWTQTGVIILVTPVIQVTTTLPGITIDGVTINPTTGEGFPLVAPP